MYNKITGVPNWVNKETRAQVVEARQEFNRSLEKLREKKDEYRQLKAENDKEREQIKKEAKIAAAFKFTKVEKKISFLPALKSKGFLQDTNGISIGTEFIEARELKKLSMPDKCLTTPKNNWKLQNLGEGSFFKRESKAEIDIYDLDYLKYMRTLERGIEKPTSLRYRDRRQSEMPLKDELELIRMQGKTRNERHQSVQPSMKADGILAGKKTIQLNSNLQSKDALQQMLKTQETSLTNGTKLFDTVSELKVTKTSHQRYQATCKFKWPPQKMTSDSFSALQPLIGRVPTPSKVQKMISLDRNFTKEVWIPSSGITSELASPRGASPSDQVLKDIAKGKQIAKMARAKKRKEKKEQMLLGIKDKLSKDVNTLIGKLQVEDEHQSQQ